MRRRLFFCLGILISLVISVTSYLLGVVGAESGKGSYSRGQGFEPTESGLSDRGLSNSSLSDAVQKAALGEDLTADNDLKKFGEQGENVAEQRVLTVVMYHSVLKSRKSEYIVSPEQFEGDLAAYKALGYATVTAKQLVSYGEGTDSLPDKPLLITFDDGHYNNLYYALPLLKKYGYTAVINVIGGFCDYTSVSGDCHNPNYSYLTWEDIRELKESGVFEIGNHTYNMHKYSPRFGVGRLKGESDEIYAAKIREDVGRLNGKLTEITGEQCLVFAYPFGRYNKVARATLSELGFKILLNCADGVNLINRGEAEDLLSLKRFNRNGFYTKERFVSALNKSYEKGLKAIAKSSEATS